jgi:hypothetical protein
MVVGEAAALLTAKNLLFGGAFALLATNAIWEDRELKKRDQRKREYKEKQEYNKKWLDIAMHSDFFINLIREELESSFFQLPGKYYLEFNDEKKNENNISEEKINEENINDLKPMYFKNILNLVHENDSKHINSNLQIKEIKKENPLREHLLFRDKERKRLLIASKRRKKYQDENGIPITIINPDYDYEEKPLWFRKMLGRRARARDIIDEGERNYNLYSKWEKGIFDEPLVTLPNYDIDNDNDIIPPPNTNKNNFVLLPDNVSYLYETELNKQTYLNEKSPLYDKEEEKIPIKTNLIQPILSIANRILGPIKHNNQSTPYDINLNEQSDPYETNLSEQSTPYKTNPTGLCFLNNFIILFYIF